MKLRNLLLALLLVFSLLTAVGCNATNHVSADTEDSSTPISEESTAEEALWDPAAFTPLLYRVTDASGNTVWLFGSIHAGHEPMTHLPDYVMDAYRQAEALAVEFDLLAFEQDYVGMITALSALVYRDGSSIRDHISEELFSDALTILKANKQYALGFDSYMPIMWSSGIDNLIMEKAGFSADFGIDRTLLTCAHEDGKTILEIESPAFQYSVLGGFSPELQALLLSESVASYRDKDARQAFKALIDAWCRGDAEQLRVLTALDTEGATEEERVLLEEYRQSLLSVRDAAMTSFAEDCLNQGNEVFICVGAAHVVGDGGMAATLAAMGCTVEAIRG